MRYFFLATLIGLSLYTHAQKTNINIKWGDLNRSSRNLAIESIIAYDSKNFFIKKIKANSIVSGIGQESKVRYEIEKFNQKLESTGSVDLTKLLKGYKETVEDIVHYQNKLFLLTTKLDRAAKNYQFFLRGISKNQLALTSKKIKVYEFDYDWTLSPPAVDYRISRDSSKLMIIYKLPGKRNENKKIGYTILDENLNKSFQENLLLPVKDKLLEINDYKVSKKGGVMIMATEYKGSRRDATAFGKPNYNFRLFYDNPGEEADKLKDIELKLEDKFITDLQLAFTANETIIGAGFYSEEGKKSIKGSYYFKINENKTAIEIEEYKDFGIDFIVTEVPERQEKKLRRRSDQGKTVEMYEYDLDQLILRDDGGVVLLAEQYYISSYSRSTSSYADPYDNSRREVVNNYHYNDIIVININPDGSIEWSKKIPKSQTTSGDRGYYSSYQSAIVKDKIYLFYNDNAKNLFKENAKKDKTHPFLINRDALMVMAVLNLEGDIKKAKLFRFGESEVYMRPKIAQQVSENEMIIYGDRARKMRFGKIIFN